MTQEQEGLRVELALRNLLWLCNLAPQLRSGSGPPHQRAIVEVMRQLNECTIRQSKLEMGGASLDSVPTLAVYAGDTCLMNAAEFCDFSTDPCQLLICNCGCVGCASGGYASFRRIGDSVALLPAFSLLASEDDFDRYQYAPPEYLTSSDGVGVFFAPSVYSMLKTSIPALPRVLDLPPLTSTEAITIIQMHAPLEVLGRFPGRPTIDRDLVLAVTAGDTEIELRQVRSFIESCLDFNLPLRVAVVSEGWTLIEFHLDGRRFPVWNDFARINNRIAINLQPFGMLIPEA